MGLAFSSPAEMAAHPWVRQLIESEVERLTPHLAQYEKVKRFALLDHDLTFDGGELTYTLKVRRRLVEQRYAELIESLYADVEEPRPIAQ
jgi:long-chain acyl-CoA synthetase